MIKKEKHRERDKMFEDIKKNSPWQLIEKISKGWSKDDKYYIKTEDGQQLLLRLSNIIDYKAKKKEYEIVKKYSKLGFPMSEPVDFGLCQKNQKVYMLLTWVEGRDLEEVLPDLSVEKQYQLGKEAGRILKKIHSIKIEDSDMPLDSKKAKKLLQLSKYEKSKVRVEGDEGIIKYIRDNIDKIWKMDPVYMHGDYHPGNLIYRDDGSIGLIDFNRWEIGDPYEEFYKLESFGIDTSIPYCIGQIDAYFLDDIPEDFWIALAVYVAHASLYSIKWAEKFGQEDIDGMIERFHRSFENYDGFKSHVPKWYVNKNRYK